MNIAERNIKNILTFDKQRKRSQEKNLHVNRMIRAFGDWTVQKLYKALEGTQVLCCAKKHEEDATFFRTCTYYESNLACGHLLYTEDDDKEPVVTAAGILATSAYTVDALAKTNISPLYIPVIEECSKKLHQLDGASFVAYSKHSQSPPTFTSVPASYIQPALNEIKDINILRTEIMKQEEEQSHPLISVRNNLLRHLTAILH